jgi:hypothetical protein
MASEFRVIWQALGKVQRVDYYTTLQSAEERIKALSKRRKLRYARIETRKVSKWIRDWRL